MKLEELIMSRTNHTTIKQTDTTTFVDYDTGEIRQEETHRTMQWESEPDYIKVYLKDICYLTNVPRACGDVLRQLCKIAAYADDENIGGMVIILNAYNRKIIQNKLGFQNSQSLTNALTDLVKGKILFKLGSGTYRLNPYLFGKGNWKDIKKLRATITWDATGKTVKTEIEHYNNQQSQSEIHRSSIKVPPEEND